MTNEAYLQLSCKSYTNRSDIRLVLIIINTVVYLGLYIFVLGKIRNKMNGFTRTVTNWFLAIILLLFITSITYKILLSTGNENNTFVVIVFEYAIFLPLNETFEMVFLWFCFKLKLVSISIEIKAETAQEVLRKIRKIDIMVKVLISFTISFILLFLILMTSL